MPGLGFLFWFLFFFNPHLACFFSLILIYFFLYFFFKFLLFCGFLFCNVGNFVAFLNILESQKKRKRDDNVNPGLVREQLISYSTDNETLGSVTCVGCCKGRSCLKSCSRLHVEKHDQMSLSEVATESNRNSIVGTESNANQKLQQYPNQSSVKLGKRSRPFRWQRRRKSKRLNFQDTTEQVCCIGILTLKDSFTQSSCLKANESDYHEKVTPLATLFIDKFGVKVLVAHIF